MRKEQETNNNPSMQHQHDPPKEYIALKSENYLNTQVANFSTRSGKI